MTVVWDLPLVFVFQVERINIEGVHDLPGVPHPHGGAVEVDQHPLVRVEVEAVRKLHTIQEGPELRTDEGTPSVGCVYVEPEALHS